MSSQESLLGAGYSGSTSEREPSSYRTTSEASTTSTSSLSTWWADEQKRKWIIGAAFGLTVLLVVIVIAVVSRAHSDSPRPPVDHCSDPARSVPFTACGLENCGTACPVTATLDTSTLSTWPSTSYLPNPYLSHDSCLTTTSSQWTCRRAELSSHLQQLELGIKPPRPSFLTGSVIPSINSNGSIQIVAGDGTTTINFTATYLLPYIGSPPYPAMIGVGMVNLNATALRWQGVAIILFPQDDVALQNGASSRGIGKFFQLFGANYSAGALIAWSWGISRMIDVLEMQTTPLFDTKHLGVTGCSRNGKGALVAGAFDERIVLTIPQESGSGGTASWRISDWQGPSTQTLGEITGENVWFQDSFKLFNSAATKLPYDHHSLQGMVAPRGLLVIENPDYVGPITPPSPRGRPNAHRHPAPPLCSHLIPLSPLSLLSCALRSGWAT